MLLKIKHLLQRFFAAKRELKTNVREFGVQIALWQFWDALFPPGKSKGYIRALSCYMRKELLPVTAKYISNEANDHGAEINCLNGKIPVWIFWWQGEAAMPDLVSVCVNRTKEMVFREETEVHIISESNFKEYVDIPMFILEKLYCGGMTIQAFSDILRYALMCKYGGMWIDATVYLTSPVSDENLSKEYFTQRFSGPEKCPREACRGKWCNFYFMGQASNQLFGYVYDALLFWWKNHDRIVDYVIVDYIIWTAYCDIPQMKNLIDEVPANNENIWELAKCMNAPYTEEGYGRLLRSNSFYKLSYKANLQTKTQDGRQTIYGKMLQEMGLG